MASTPDNSGGDYHTNNDSNDNNRLSHATLTTDVAASTGTPGSPTLWTSENWRHDIRTPLKTKKDPTSHAFSPATALKNFIHAALALRNIQLRFLSLADDTHFIDGTAEHPILSDEILQDHYMQGALGRFEHGKIKYFLRFRVALAVFPFLDIKSRMLRYLQFNDTWLAQNKFPTLEIFSAGAFSLCHPHWTRLPHHHQSIRKLIHSHIANLDLTILTADQHASLEPLLANGTILKFDLHIQSI